MAGIHIKSFVSSFQTMTFDRLRKMLTDSSAHELTQVQTITRTRYKQIKNQNELLALH